MRKIARLFAGALRALYERTAQTRPGWLLTVEPGAVIERRWWKAVRWPDGVLRGASVWRGGPLLLLGRPSRLARAPFEGRCWRWTAAVPGEYAGGWERTRLRAMLAAEARVETALREQGAGCCCEGSGSAA